jgi:hypothetical protein
MNVQNMNPTTTIIEGMSNDMYHSQEDAEVPRLSYSTAKTIIQKSPLHAWNDHPLGGNARKESSASMDMGSIIHGLLLGHGDEIVEIDADSFRTKLAKELRDEANAAGKIPILKSKMDEIRTLEESVKSQLREIYPRFFESHFSELTVYWEADNGVKCQSRWDWISPEDGLIIDVKSTADASPEKCERKILDMGYHIQQFMYTRAAEKAWPEMAGRFNFRFLFIETETPYAINIAEADTMFYELGSLQAYRAAEQWRVGLETGKWNGYGETFLYCPAWAMTKEELNQ